LPLPCLSRSTPRPPPRPPSMARASAACALSSPPPPASGCSPSPFGAFARRDAYPHASAPLYTLSCPASTCLFSRCCSQASLLLRGEPMAGFCWARSRCIFFTARWRRTPRTRARRPSSRRTSTWSLGASARRRRSDGLGRGQGWRRRRRRRSGSSSWGLLLRLRLRLRRRLRLQPRSSGRRCDGNCSSNNKRLRRLQLLRLLQPRRLPATRGTGRPRRRRPSRRRRPPRRHHRRAPSRRASTRAQEASRWPRPRRSPQG